MQYKKKPTWVRIFLLKWHKRLYCKCPRWKIIFLIPRLFLQFVNLTLLCFFHISKDQLTSCRVKFLIHYPDFQFLQVFQVSSVFQKSLRYKIIFLFLIWLLNEKLPLFFPHFLFLNFWNIKFNYCHQNLDNLNFGLEVFAFAAYKELSNFDGKFSFPWKFCQFFCMDTLEW